MMSDENGTDPSERDCQRKYRKSAMKNIKVSTTKPKPKNMLDMVSLFDEVIQACQTCSKLQNVSEQAVRVGCITVNLRTG
jgi:hypothetical protein